LCGVVVFCGVYCVVRATLTRAGNGNAATITPRIYCNIVAAGRGNACGHKLAPALLLRGRVVVVAVMRCGRALG
jgi:hypothetical protein